MTLSGRKDAALPDAMVKGPVRLALNSAWASAIKVWLKKRSLGSGSAVNLVTSE